MRHAQARALQADKRAVLTLSNRAAEWRLDYAERSADAPYLAALQDYARRDAARFHVPAHKGGPAAAPQLATALGAALELDVPACIDGIDRGPGETPLDAAERLAAEAWGARRTWFLVNGATEASHALCLALGLGGGSVVVQRNVHASTMHGLVLAGLRPVFVAPEVDPVLGIAHCVTPQELDAALDRALEAIAAFVVSPTYFGAVADVAGLVAVCRARGVALIVDEAWGAHFRFNDALPEGALQAGADAVISGTHKLVGSLTQSAMLHVGERRCAALGDEAIAGGLALVRSTSPNSLLLASLDVARAHAMAHGRSALDAALRAASALKDEIRAIDGLAVLDEHLCGRHGIAGFDPLRVTIDVTGTGRTGHEIADALLRDADINLELITRTVLIAHLGMAEDLGAAGLRLIEALRTAAAAAPEPRPAPAPVPAPLFGVPALAPREAFFARHERLLRPPAGSARRPSRSTRRASPTSSRASASRSRSSSTCWTRSAAVPLCAEPGTPRA